MILKAFLHYLFLVAALVILLLSLLMFEDFFNPPAALGLTRQSTCWIVVLYLTFISFLYKKKWPLSLNIRVAYVHALLTLVFIVVFVAWINVVGPALLFETQFNLNQTIFNPVKAAARLPYAAGTFVSSLIFSAILIYLLAGDGIKGKSY